MTLHPLVVGTMARDRVDRLMEVGAAERRPAAMPRRSRRPSSRRLALGQLLASAGAGLVLKA